METLLALLVGFLTAAGIYMMLNLNLVRFMFGLVLISNAANFTILAAGRYEGAVPALVPEGLKTVTTSVANGLPQALILTAIVISFGILAFSVVLILRTYQELGTVRSDRMRIADTTDYAPKATAPDGQGASEVAGS